MYHTCDCSMMQVDPWLR